jgi:hypothetical protein
VCISAWGSNVKINVYMRRSRGQCSLQEVGTLKPNMALNFKFTISFKGAMIMHTQKAVWIIFDGWIMKT